MSQVSAEFTRKSSSSSESGNLLTPDLVDQQLSSDEADADEPGAVRNLPLAPEAGPQTDIGSADGQLPVTLAPALEAADDVDENEPGASEDDDDSGNDDRPSPRRRKEVVQEVDKAQAAASDHQRTVELQQETLADVRRQLEESQRANQLLRASSSAPTSALPPASRSPNAEVNVASTSRGHNVARSTMAPAVAHVAVGRSLATSTIPAPLAPNASRSLVAPLAHPGLPAPRPAALETSPKLPESLTELTFFTAKCNQAVLYFIAEAPPREINFWPEPQELRQQLIPVYGSKWHCDPDTGRPFANKAFDMALCKGLGGRRCKTMFAKIPVVATICHVVEWPMANAGSRDTPALDGSDSNNRREVQLKVGVIIDWIKDRLSRGDNIYRDTAPAGFQMGANPLVRIVIAGFEDEFAGLLP
ncbi:unnamed protein product [Closterium sp. Naga37s-1]|nr:unnamed protein product [Closterium sp. Naga37s-1]